MTKKSIRRIIRERVVQILYALEYNRDAREALVGGLLSDLSTTKDIEFAQNLVSKCLLYQQEADWYIEKRLANWELERIAILDKIVMRLGIIEMLYFADIPPKVTINECIDLGKEFGTADSGKFINGILNKILVDLTEEGKLSKAGRGLIDSSEKQ